LDEEMTEPFKSEVEEFSADENEEEILAEVDAQDEDDEEEDLPPPMEDELMSNPLMSDFSSLNPPPSNSQTQHKSLFDRKNHLLIDLQFSFFIILL
jgi:hypothetical protein